MSDALWSIDWPGVKALALALDPPGVVETTGGEREHLLEQRAVTHSIPTGTEPACRSTNP